MTEYVNLPIETDPDSLVEIAFDYMEDVTGGVWTPADGNLDVWLLYASALLAAEVRDLASDVPAAIFRYLGAKVFGIVPDSGANAIGVTSWTVKDTSGYSIPDGTVIGIRNSDDTLVYFLTVGDTPVPTGQTTVTGVNVRSFDLTDEANGLAGPKAELIDALDYVNAVTVTQATAGGAGPETDDAYLDRLVRKMQLIAPRPIIAKDFGLMALDVDGVARVTYIDGYDPVTGTTNNARMITLFGLDANGNIWPALTRTTVKSYLEANREVNFVVNVADPTMNSIDVAYTATVYPGFNADNIKAQGDAAIAQYLAPLTWGTPDTSEAGIWYNKTLIEEYELATVLNNVEGLNRVTSLSFGFAGQTLAKTPLTLIGAAPLPQLNSVTSSVT